MSITNTFANHPALRGDPYARLAAITPSDSVDLTFVTTGIWVGTGGAVRLTTATGQTVTLTSVPGGAFLPVQATRVHSTGTTASNMFAASSA